MVGRHVLEVELVQVGIDVDTLRDRLGVIFAAGQWRQEREFEDVKRQFALNDLDALDQRFLRVVRNLALWRGLCNRIIYRPHPNLMRNRGPV
jgi:hypothetical protein